MIAIDTARFNLHIQNEAFARSLYVQWDEFCRTTFEKVVEEVLSPFDGEGDLSVERLVLDLGQVTEQTFYEEYPKRLRNKLSEAWQALVRSPSSFGLTSTASRTAAPLEQLSFYLRRGFMSGNGSGPRITPRQATEKSIQSSPAEFKNLLEKEGWNPTIQRRLIFQLEDRTLEKTVALTHPGPGAFITRYARSLINSIPRVTTAPGRLEYRNAVWLLLFSYLYSRNKGKFSLRELVRQTLSDLAARFSMKAADLLAVVLSTGRETLPSDGSSRELLLILEEIEQKESVGTPRIVISPYGANKQSPCNRYTSGESQASSPLPARLSLLKNKWKSVFPNISWEKMTFSMQNAPSEKKEIKAWADSPSLFLWLNKLDEKETEDWVRYLLPREESSRFLFCARTLKNWGNPASQLPCEKRSYQTALWACVIKTALERPSSGANLADIIQKKLKESEIQALSSDEKTKIRLKESHKLLPAKEAETGKTASSPAGPNPHSHRQPLPQTFPLLKKNSDPGHPPEKQRPRKDGESRNPKRLLAKEQTPKKTPDRAVLITNHGDSSLNFQRNANQTAQPRMSTGREEEKELPAEGLTIPGSGLVLFSPWLPLFFEKSGLLNEAKEDFVSTGARIRAVFLMQALLYEEPEREFEEEDLALCRILTETPFTEPLPRRIDLTEEERNLAQSLLQALVKTWGKLAETAPQAIRDSFLIRPGLMREQGQGWLLTLEARPYDMLLDTLPWNYTLVKMPWMDKMLTTKWK